MFQMHDTESQACPWTATFLTSLTSDYQGKETSIKQPRYEQMSSYRWGGSVLSPVGRGEISTLHQWSGPPVPSDGILSEGDKRDSEAICRTCSLDGQYFFGNMDRGRYTPLRSQRLGLGRGGSYPLACHTPPRTLRFSGVAFRDGCPLSGLNV